MIQHEKIDAAVMALNKYGIDMWVTIGRETVMNSEPALPLIFWGDAVGITALIIKKSGETIAIAHKWDTAGIRRQRLFDRVVGYGERSFDEVFGDEISDSSPRKIALNFSETDPAADGLSAGLYMRLMTILNEMHFTGELVPAIDIMVQLRQRKSEEEINRISAAIAQTVAIYEEAASYIKPGLTETDIFNFFADGMKKRGASPAWSDACDPIVMVGTETIVGHIPPNPDIMVKRGDVINVDFGIKVNGYCSDLQRIYYVLADGETEAPAEVRKAFDTVREAIKLASGLLRPGTNGADIAEEVQQYIKRAGYEWKDGIGHQIGMYGHDGGPGLTSRIGEETPLQENMVFTLELSIVTSRGCVGQEEVAVVKQAGGQMLSKPQKEIYLIH